jgi:hypothetical protein
MQESMVWKCGPVDINYSTWDNLLEEKAGNYCALRLGFRQVKACVKKI